MSLLSNETISKLKLDDFINAIKSQKEKFIQILKNNKILVVKGDGKKTSLNIINAIKNNQNFTRDIAELIISVKKSIIPGTPGTSSYTGEDPEVLNLANDIRNTVSLLGDTISSELLSSGIADVDLSEAEEKDYTTYYIIGAILLLMVFLAIIYRKKILALLNK